MSSTRLLSLSSPSNKCSDISSMFVLEWFLNKSVVIYGLLHGCSWLFSYWSGSEKDKKSLLVYFVTIKPIHKVSIFYFACGRELFYDNNPHCFYCFKRLFRAKSSMEGIQCCTRATTRSCNNFAWTKLKQSIDILFRIMIRLGWFGDRLLPTAPDFWNSL